MKINSFGIVLSSLFALIKAESYKFNVVSILGEGSLMGVKYGNNVVPLNATAFPLFTGTVEAENISKYKYVSLDTKNNIIEEESISRTYSKEISTINEVYNRTNKNVILPELPNPLDPIYPLGSEKFKALPDSFIYNVYAKCDETIYLNVTSFPFLKPPRSGSNNQPFSCNFTIITPDTVFQSEGTMHLIGFSSRAYKKLSWAIKFADKNKFMGRKTMKLRGNANDASLMREKLATKLYTAIGIPTMEVSYTRLFINGDTYGLYYFGDSTNKRWLGSYLHGDPKATIGFSYKLLSSPGNEYADLRYLGDNYKLYKKRESYEIDEFDDSIDKNNESAIWTPLAKFTKLYDQWVKKYQNDPSDEAIEALQKFLNIEVVLRVLAMDTLTMPLDNFWLIMSNSDIYYDPERDNYTIIPYDFDQTFRGSWEIEYINPNNYISDCITWVNYDEKMYEHYFTNHLLEHPQIRKRYDVILSEIVHKTFDSDVISNYITKLAGLIRDDVEWNVKASQNLKIGYNGKVKSFTLSQFDKSYTKTYKKGKAISSSYDFKEFIDIRGDYCRAYTADVDVSDNSNIGSTDAKKFEDANNESTIIDEVTSTITTSPTEYETTTEVIIETSTQSSYSTNYETETYYVTSQPTSTEVVTPTSKTSIPTSIPTSSAQGYNFNVISILDKEYSLGVKYNNKVVPLQSSLYPIFSGAIDDDINEYKYVALDKENKVVKEESITRKYNKNTPRINEVFDRYNKNVTLSELSSPFKPMFSMGSNTYQPLPDNVIYNVIATCDEKDYADLTTNPFTRSSSGSKKRNESLIDCTINIVSPENNFQSTGSMKLIGYTSRKYKKLSWKINLDEKKFFGRKTLDMRGIANEVSLMREKVASHLYNAVDVPTQEGAYARLFINGDIYGLYLMADHLDKEWIGAYIHGNENSRVGIEYELSSSTPDGPFCDLKYLGDDYKLYVKADTYSVNIYDKEALDSNSESSKWSSLINFTKLFDQWVKTYKNDNSDAAVKELKKFLNIESTLRLMAIDTLTMPINNFFLFTSSTSLYYNPERKNYQFIPYEFEQVLLGSYGDASMDPNNYISDCITWVNYKEDVNEHYFTNNLLSHPQIKKRYDVILAEILSTTYDSKRMDQYIQSLGNLIRDEVQWNIDAVKNLSIPYDGKIKSLTMKKFEDSISYRHSSSDNRDYFELGDFVATRGKKCRAYTANVDTSDNTNISD